MELNYKDPHIAETINFSVGKTAVESRFAINGIEGVSPEEMRQRIRKVEHLAGKILARHHMETAG